MARDMGVRRNFVRGRHAQNRPTYIKISPLPESHEKKNYKKKKGPPHEEKLFMGGGRAPTMSIPLLASMAGE